MITRVRQRFSLRLLGNVSRALPVVLGFAFFFSTCAKPPPLDPKVVAEKEKIALGKKLFSQQCVTCHALDGTTLETSAIMRPNDLRTATYKFRSTPTGTLPTDKDLYRVMKYGVLGTTMPSYHWMSTKDLDAVIAYTKTLSPVWKDPAFEGKPIEIPDAPQGMFENKQQFLIWALAGREIFGRACATCHGFAGRGNGPSVAGLRDNWGNPVRPADLTQPYIKRGYDARDLYQAPATGLNGTPMPSFANTLDKEEIWELVAYMLYLRKEASGKIETGTIPPVTPPSLEEVEPQAHSDSYLPLDEGKLEKLFESDKAPESGSE